MQNEKVSSKEIFNRVAKLSKDVEKTDSKETKQTLAAVLLGIIASNPSDSMARRYLNTVKRLERS